MAKNAATFLFALVVACAGAAPGLARDEQAPLLSLVQAPGLAMGGDRKFIFALYENGTVIHALRDSDEPPRRSGRPEYVRDRLTPEEKTALLQRLRPEDLRSAPKRFEHSCDWPTKIPIQTVCDPPDKDGSVTCHSSGPSGSCWTDAGYFSLTWRDGSQTTEIGLIGGLDGGPSDDRSEAPAALLRIWDALTTFDRGGQSWTPDRTLLSFVTREGFKDHPRRESCPWPSELGGEHAGPEEFRDGNFCRVLPAAVREPAREWIRRCHGLARVKQDWFVSIDELDLLPGEAPAGVSRACR